MLLIKAIDASEDDVLVGSNGNGDEEENGYALSQQDNQFIAIMGFLAVLGYGIGMVGSLAFMAFSLYAFQAGKPDARPANYYRGRLIFYCFCLFVSGISQMLLGTYIYTSIDVSPFSFVLLEHPLDIAMYTVSYPEVAVYVGAIQAWIALFGMTRACGFANVTNKSN